MATVQSVRLSVDDLRYLLSALQHTLAVEPNHDYSLAAHNLGVLLHGHTVGAHTESYMSLMASTVISQVANGIRSNTEPHTTIPTIPVGATTGCVSARLAPSSSGG